MTCSVSNQAQWRSRSPHPGRRYGRRARSLSFDVIIRRAKFCWRPARVFLRELSSSTVRSDIQCLSESVSAVLQAKLPALFKEVAISSSTNSHRMKYSSGAIQTHITSQRSETSRVPPKK
ncbi:hypothetical protein T265_09493 [Opisthorchis viverrini]|uniref:Uncharacterized protein n=1 Tax=Opisthorchis viverrini TaxID=6198 RepID=A0A074Z5R4_OPIVI|nr:hypothetical protein T265_09493 [Opisthorchis viverrini]KER22413.1 hypothetical protein T265_09493 [Opisthorchis viverrini]